MAIGKPGFRRLLTCGMRASGIVLVLAAVGCQSAKNPNGLALNSTSLGSMQSLLQNLSHPQLPGTQSAGTQTQSYGNQGAYQQQQYAPASNQAQQPATQQQSAAGAQAEAAFRQKLMTQGMGFGGIFGPSLKKWRDTPSAPASQQSDGCGDYSEYSAKQACKSGNGWAADRLQNHESDDAEKDWYNR
jgi:hypothetical protein